MNATSWIRTSLALVASIAAAGVLAGTATLRGYWIGPSGSVIQITPCEMRLCVRIVALPAGPHPSTDAHNPDPSLRGRPLCGLLIGEGFAEKGERRAEGGRLYDPRNGRTYRAAMKADGDRLELRGFIGLRIFGRTEIWRRAHRIPRPCGPG